MTFRAEDGEADFSLVDNKPRPKTKRKVFRPTPNFRGASSRTSRQPSRTTRAQPAQNPAAQARPKKVPLSAQSQEIKDATLRPEDSWGKLGEYEFASLKNISGEEPEAVTDLYDSLNFLPFD